MQTDTPTEPRGQAAPTPRRWRLPAVLSAPALIATVTATAVGLAALLQPQRADAERVDRLGWSDLPARMISSLKGIAPPAPEIGDIIVDPLAAQQLGKALFWDTQVGRDGTACASCHFHAGADVRTSNQVSPGRKGGRLEFAARARQGGKMRPNVRLEPADFPLHQVEDPADRESKIVFDTSDIVGSQGALAGAAVSDARPAAGAPVKPSDASAFPCSTRYNPFDAVRNVTGSPFHYGRLMYRQVEPRHTPTVINAVFYSRQFWDGRASRHFNGVDPFGARSYAPLETSPPDGHVAVGNPFAAGLGILVPGEGAAAPMELIKPLIDHASLASQAVAVPHADFATACEGKRFADLARRIADLQPLSGQVVDPTDSLFSRSPELVNSLRLTGLATTYSAMIKKAFSPRYWGTVGRFSVDPATGAVSTDPAGGATQLEHNFSLFFGLALQAYEALLISDDAPFDRGPAALSEAQRRGEALFTGKANCVACHNGPLFSSAAYDGEDGSPPAMVDARLMGDGWPALIDQGFHNTGVRPTSEDRGLGGLDPYGFDLSFSRQYIWRQHKRDARSPDDFEARPCSFQQRVATGCDTFNVGTAHSDREPRIERDAVDGAFKVPTLRNVGLTPPYFHNGGQSNLKDVVRFYNRGSDRRGPIGADTSGLATPTPFGLVNRSNIDPNIGNPANRTGNNGLGLSEEEMDDIVQFLLALTDQRVACHSDVFDHPELPLVIGQRDIALNGTQVARDIVATLPATGRRGLRTCLPNSGDLFGSLNPADKRKLPDVLEQVLQVRP